MSSNLTAKHFQPILTAVDLIKQKSNVYRSFKILLNSYNKNLTFKII